MNKKLNYPDDIVLIETAQNGYGDNYISHAEHLKGLFITGTSQNMQNHVEVIGDDAHVYLDIENAYVKENAFRLEGMYIVANPFDGKEREAWYKISRVKVGQRKLLDNAVNNVHCFLTKSSSLGDYES